MRKARRRFRLRSTLALLCASVLLTVVVVRVVSEPSSTVRRSPGATPFAPNSIWNAELPASAPIASDSRALVAELQRQVTTYKTWINTYAYSTPVYTVPSTERRVPVVLDQRSPSGSVHLLSSVFNAGIPIPPHAVAAPGTDKAMVIFQPSTNTMWELWLAHRSGGSWHAMWGGKMADVSTNSGYFTAPPDWGTAATSLTLLGGLIRMSDLRAGRIDHALALAIPQARNGVFASPAQRTDGGLNSPNAVPEGTRFRLDPRLDVAALHLSPVTQMLALAAQHYGLFIRDQAGAVTFSGEQNTSPGPDPDYRSHGLFGGLSPGQITSQFPWSHLEAVAAPLHRQR